jgi:hypothetical protein
MQLRSLNKAWSIWERSHFINILGEYWCFGITFRLHRQVCGIKSVWHSRDEGKSTVRFYTAFPPGRWSHFPPKGWYPSKKLYSAITENTKPWKSHTMEIWQKKHQLIVCHNTTNYENPGKKVGISSLRAVIGTRDLPSRMHKFQPFYRNTPIFSAVDEDTDYFWLSMNGTVGDWSKKCDISQAS